MGSPVHVRRCHVCGAVTEKQEDVLKCDGCGKALLPFYYFDKRKIPVPSDANQAEPEAQRSSRGTQDEYGPIFGLTAYW